MIHLLNRSKIAPGLSVSAIIVETENANNAKEIIQNWTANFFGRSDCRDTKAKRPLYIILKGEPLADHVSDTGVDEKDLQEEISKQIPGNSVTLVKRQDKTPLKLLKITLENEEQVEGALKSEVCFGNLRIQPEIEYRPPKVVQCFKCLKFGHISAFCKSRHEHCSICPHEGHNHKNCTKENEKCKNCNGPHAAVSRYCPIKQEE